MSIKPEDREGKKKGDSAPGTALGPSMAIWAGQQHPHFTGEETKAGEEDLQDFSKVMQPVSGGAGI